MRKPPTIAKPAWIVASVLAGKLLPVAPFLLERSSVDAGQAGRSRREPLSSSCQGCAGCWQPGDSDMCAPLHVCPLLHVRNMLGKGRMLAGRCWRRAWHT